MKRLFALAAVCAAVFLSAQSSSAAVISVFSNNQAGWNAAAGSPVVTETFGGGPLVPGLAILSGNGTISGGVYNDIVDNPIGSPIDQVTFGFSTPITAFGGNFDLSPGGAGSGIQFLLTFVGGGTQLVGTQVPNSFNGQFFGFVSDTPITQVQLFGGTQAGVQETFTLDNVQFVQTPEPATLAVFGLMAAGAFGVRRRLKATA